MSSPQAVASAPVQPLTAAIAYAQAKLAFVPLHGIRNGRCTCGNPACTQRGRHARRDRTISDVAQARTHFTKNPTDNIGLALGASALFALAVDGQTGHASLKQLEHVHGALLETLRATDGCADYILFRSQRAVRSMPSGAYPGLTIMGAGEYLPIAPSATSSGACAWTNWKPGSEAPTIGDGPPWLIALAEGRCPPDSGVHETAQPMPGDANRQEVQSAAPDLEAPDALIETTAIATVAQDVIRATPPPAREPRSIEPSSSGPCSSSSPAADVVDGESMVDTALMLREHGFSPFPLGAHGEEPTDYFIRERHNGDLEKAREQWPKSPRITSWRPFQTAVASEEQIRAWWGAAPRANIGLACGELVVIDTDSAEASKWALEHLTPTPWRVRTSKGMHLYFRRNPDLEIRNSANPGIKVDVRAAGGYVVAGSSVHASGVRYENDIANYAKCLSLAELPMIQRADIAAIRAYAQRSGPPVAKVGGGNLAGFDAATFRQAATGEPVAEGGRNNAAASIAGRFIRNGLSVADTTAELRQWNATNPKPLPDTELCTTVKSIARTHAANNPGAAPATAAAEFSSAPADLWGRLIAPTAKADLFPRVVSDYAFEVAEVSGFDPGFVAMASMVALGGVIHDDTQIQCKRTDPTFLQSARLWTALVGSPSAKKSPIIKKVFSRLFSIEKQLRTQNEADYAKYRGDITAWKASSRKAERDGNMPPAEPSAPQLIRLVTDDTTVEKLQISLAQNPRGIIQVRDELSGWFTSMGAYGERGSAGKDEAHWLQLYDGGFRTFDRVGRPDVMVSNWGASLVGGIQPDAIKKIAAKLPHNGLLQRFLPVIGQRQTAHDRHINMTPVSAFGDLLEHIYQTTPCAQPVMMSVAADDERKRVLARLDELIASFDTSAPRLASHLGKWEGVYSRLVLVVHCVECAEQRVHPTAVEVSHDSAVLVERLMFKYLLPHLMRFYDDVLEEGCGTSERLDDAQKVAEHILTKGWQEFTDRGVTQAVKRWRHRSDRERAEAYSALEATSWVMPLDGLNQRGIAKAYRVNPAVHTVFAKRRADFGEAMRVIADLLSPASAEQ